MSIILYDSLFKKCLWGKTDQHGHPSHRTFSLAVNPWRMRGREDVPGKVPNRSQGNMLVCFMLSRVKLLFVCITTRYSMAYRRFHDWSLSLKIPQMWSQFLLLMPTLSVKSGSKLEFQSRIVPLFGINANII